MKEIVIISGKGGTGKTSLTGSLAVLAERKILVDCDVDAADLHLLLKPAIIEKHEFWSGQKARIDPQKCSRCGICQDICRFNAISNFTVEEFSCEGCALCEKVCPTRAINMQDSLSGYWYVSNTRLGTLVHAKLGIAQENSGKLVAAVRQKARDLAEAQQLDYIISDGPPGIGCPVISAISGVDLAVLVTEPTLSGIHDLKRVLEVCRHFSVPALVCINKYDLNLEITDEIENFCREAGVKAAARIPYDNAVLEAMIKGLPVQEYSAGPVSRAIAGLWESIQIEISTQKNK